MAKHIKEIAKKSIDGSYEKVLLGAISLSELENDQNFITNTVNNLTNYYTKTEIYTQAEIHNLLNTITTLDIKVVTTLPTENISATTIYLKTIEGEINNSHEEWLYINNTWELIGTTKVDLTLYALKTDIPTKTSQLTNDSNFITNNEITALESKYAKLSKYGDASINIGRKGLIGLYSSTVGNETTATGTCSWAEGRSTTSSAYATHAEGGNTTASGQYSHSEGSWSVASGVISHAEGSYAMAEGDYSHAEGQGTIAQGDHCHTQGKYNIADTENKYAHIVGNGTGSEEGNRSNAHTLDWNGNAWFKGDVYVGSASGKNRDENSKKLAIEENHYTKMEIDNLLNSISGDLILVDPQPYEDLV